MPDPESRMREMREEIIRLRDKQHELSNVVTTALFAAKRCEETEKKVDELRKEVSVVAEKVIKTELDVASLKKIEDARTMRIVSIVGLCATIAAIVGNGAWQLMKMLLTP